MSTTPYPQSPVSAAVWPWTRPVVTAKKRGGPLRVLIQAAIPLAAAAYLVFGRGITSLPWVIVPGLATLIGCVILLTGLFFPPVFHRIEHGVFRLVHYVGVAIAWILLVPLYYTFFLLGHLGLVLKGKDLLHRKLQPEAPSYWIDRKPPKDPATYYRRQY